MLYEVMIIGGGPAGLSAAVYTARKRLHTLLIAKDIGGQMNWTLSIENYLGYQFITAQELITKFQDQINQFPVDQQVGVSIVQVTHSADSFEATDTEGNKYRAKTVIFATGKKPKRLEVPGEKEFTGRGISYCAICDGPLFASQNVAVIGGGNSAIQAVLDMIKIVTHVDLVTTTALTSDKILSDKVIEADNVTIYTGYEVEKVDGDTFVSSITIKNLKTREHRKLNVTGVFVEIGLVPNSEAVSGLVRLNNNREISVDCKGNTNITGFFAAGDVTDVPEKQILIAAGEGAKAALRSHRYLQTLME